MKIQKKTVLWILVIFGASILYQVMFNQWGSNYYDAHYYRHLAQQFWVEGRFSLNNFPDVIRGVCFPLVLSFFVNVDVIWGWRVFAACMTIYFVFFFPKMLVDNVEIKGRKALILFVLIYTFWSGLFLYFLSDAVALMFLSIGVSLILKDKKINYLVGGIFLYFAYNTRTIYLFPILFIGFCIVCYKLIKKDKSILVSMLLVTLGIMIAAIPQVIVNKNSYGILSAKVITTGGYGNGLFTWQLAEGLKLGEYETYVGDDEIYPHGEVRFADSVGERIFEKEQIDSYKITIKGMIKLVLKYPLEIIGIYVRHFINMLNPVWGEVYIKNLEKIKVHLMIINYILLYIFVYWNVVVKEKKITKVRELLYKENEAKLKIYIARLTLLIPCIAILPGCVELRFFYPMYMLFYVYIIYDIGIEGIKKILSNCRKNYMQSIVSFVVGFCILCAIAGNTYSNLEGSLWISLI